jgi:hypothetical protein
MDASVLGWASLGHFKKLHQSKKIGPLKGPAEDRMESQAPDFQCISPVYLFFFP